MKKLTSEWRAGLQLALATLERVSVEQQENGCVCIRLNSSANATMLRTNTKGDGLSLVDGAARMEVLAARDFSLAKYVPIAEVAGKRDPGYANKHNADMYVRRVLRVTLPAVLEDAP